MRLAPPVPRAALSVLGFFVAAISPNALADNLRLDLGSNVSLELVEVQPGSFQQGSKPDEQGRRPDETARTVQLTKRFFLGKYPVTREQFSAFIRETGYRTEAETGVSGGFGWSGQELVQKREFNWRNPGFVQTERDPVTTVTYKDAEAFLAWLTRKSGREFRLPTEAEWEYACRAGSSTVWPGGNAAADGDAAAWHKANAGNGTEPVGQKAPNAWGLHDMLGNVWEWCADWYAPYDPASVVDPIQTNPNLSDKPRRVLRGGSWLRPREDCRPSSRYRNDPGSRNADNGFRVMTFAAAPGTAPVAASTPASDRSKSQQPGASSTPRPPVQLEDDSATGRATGDKIDAVPLTSASPPHRKGSALVGLGIIGAAIAAVVALLRGIFGGRSAFRGREEFVSGRTTPPSIGRPVFTRVADDGFWISGDAVRRGSLLTCRWEAGDSSHESQIAYEPGPEGHFIYTGQRPSHVSVVMADAPGFTDSAGIRNVPPPLRPTSSTPTPRREPPRYQGNPPAY